jgi:hypothetical protein
MGLYIGFKAAPLGAANVSTLARLATLFNVTMDVVGFVHAMQSLRAGKATFFDYIALAAPLAHFSALRAPDARQASVLDSLERAANGGVLDIAQTVGSKAVVVLKMTPRMARKEVSAFLKYSHLAQVLPNARGKRISQIQGIARQLEPGRDVIALTEGVVQRLSSMFPGLRIRREYSTVGQVDSLYRALWRRLLQEAGDSLEGWAAGHRLDLGVNRIGAHYEVRAFKTIMENLTSGNPEVRELGKQLIMRMFQKHLASSNSAVGSSWTKAISNGLAEGSQFVVRGG